MFSEPTVCPYGTPVRVEFENIRDTNKGSNTPYVVQISTSGRRGLPAELKELNFDGDSSPEILKPYPIARTVCTIETYLL